LFHQFGSSIFTNPVSEAARDGRLQPATQVLAVKSGEEVRGYPLVESGSGVIAETVDDQPLVVFTDPDGPTGAAFEPIASGRELTFDVRNGEFVDRETESVWNLAGQAIRGPLNGAQLLAIPSRTTFWFAIVAAEPEITLYQATAD
jgi:hypothetical protein